jgi:6-pyruvoyltetrahydropterin/6-carboxytetrahydropterin synthase
MTFSPVSRFTRRYRFSASHRLHLPALTDVENRAIYGKCNNPFGHGHDYLLEVTIAGTPDPLTGLILPRHDLDQWVESKVLKLFDHRNINTDVAGLSASVPTTENIALFVARLLAEDWPRAFPAAPGRLARVHILETDRNGFEVLISERRVDSPMRKPGAST